MNLEIKPLEPSVQKKMNDFKSALKDIRMQAFKLYLILTPENGDQQWAAKVMDPLYDINDLLENLFKAEECEWERGPDGGIVIPN